MRLFAEAYPDFEIGAQAVRQIPWGNIVLLLQKVKAPEIRDWYALKTLEHGWSRSILQIQIEQSLYSRQAVPDSKTNNFKLRLPSPQSDLAEQMLKNPYCLDFLTPHDQALERELEEALTTHITKFLLELGTGFAFIGNQVPLTIDTETFYVDMLFYHLKLRCYVVVELKARAFKPEDAGKLNFYLTAVDHEIKDNADNPTIGILLCKTRNKVIAEYALKNITSPIGVSEYELTRAMPEDLKTSLPSIEEIEDQLSSDLDSC